MISLTVDTSQIENGFAAFGLGASRVESGATGFGLGASRVENDVAGMAMKASRVESGATRFGLRASQSGNGLAEFVVIALRLEGRVAALSVVSCAGGRVRIGFRRRRDENKKAALDEPAQPLLLSIQSEEIVSV